MKLFPRAGPQSFDGVAKLAAKGDDNPGMKAAKEKEARWLRIVSNDLENIPLGMAIAWGTLQITYSPKVHAILVLAFAISRYISISSFNHIRTIYLLLS